MKQHGLDRYQDMRRFEGTPEPRGARAPRRQAGLRYFIQKHSARALHYDFRLELDGVLRSWAVPKGPSLKAGDKRLAVEVEDHPVEYGSFEGTIPKGNYGAGTVEVWDQGIWTPEGDPRRGLERGRLTFRLEGGRLKGVWSLVRMRTDQEKKVNWLLIRSNKKRLSVPSAANPAPSPRKVPAAERIQPALATLVAVAPRGDAWIHELKFDGYRLLARVDGSDIRLLTRAGRDWTHRFGPIQAALARMKLRDSILDGELVALAENGVSDFSALQKALTAGKVSGLVYHVFDLLRLKGQDLRDLPLLERKARLEKLFAPHKKGTIRYTDHVRGSGEAVQREACRLGLEGIVSKKVDSPYLPGRGHDWVKTKCVKEQEFVIGGYTDPQGSREGLGALLLGYHADGGRLIYAGRVGTGFDSTLLKDLRQRLGSLHQGKTPYAEGPVGAERQGVHWVEPSLVAQIRFTGWTDDRRLRHPVFHGLREDKPAAEVGLEKTEDEPKSPGKSGVAGVAISHPDRVIYPEQRLTKLAVAQYYERVSERMLPFIAGRPLSLLRCPDGRSSGCFYQKNWPKAGSAVKTLEISGKSGSNSAPVIADAAGLVSLIQNGALEIHPWGSRAGSIETPDVCILDLDPSPEVPWPDLAAAARSLRERLESLGLESFLKTTGGKGLHVVVPLTGAIRWDALKAFARSLAADLAREEPDRYTATMSKEARKGRIYIDWLRNGRGATAVAPYSTRARANAPVASPLTWDELETIDRADAFTVLTILPRLDRDPWEGYFKVKQQLPGPRRGRA